MQSGQATADSGYGYAYQVIAERVERTTLCGILDILKFDKRAPGEMQKSHMMKTERRYQYD